MQSLFGTDGIRGNFECELFSHTSLVQLGVSIGTWIVQQYGESPSVLIGTDTRHSADFIKSSLCSGLMATSVNILDAAIIPTPLAAHMLDLMPRLSAAIVISASHNPADDNGIKLFTQKQGKLTVEDEQAITRYFYNSRLPCEEPQSTLLYFPEARTHYQHRLAEMFSHVNAHQYHLVLDTAHGATSSYAEELFKITGARVTVINNSPDGRNINKECGSTAPYILQQALHHYRADIGFAFDGDGDRVVAVNPYGELKHGDDILCLLLDHPDYHTTPAIVGTIMTNGGLEAYVQQRGVQLIRTPVGDRHISDVLSRNNLLLGGEPVGHIILKNHLYTGDGMLVALKLLETIIATGNRSLTTFTGHPQVAHKIAIKKRYNLECEPFASLIQHAQNSCDHGRVIVRYSGTENVLRVMIEAYELSQAQEQCAILVHNLEEALRTYHE